MSCQKKRGLEADDLADVVLPGFLGKGDAEMAPAERARVLMARSLHMLRSGVAAFHAIGFSGGSAREQGESLSFIADAMRHHLVLAERAQRVLLAAVQGSADAKQRAARPRPRRKVTR